MTYDAIPERSQIPLSDTWDLGALYPSEEAWQADYERLIEASEQASRFAGTLGSSSENFLAALCWFSEKGQLAERMIQYAFLCYAADAGDAQNKRKMGLAIQAHTRFAAATSFFEPEIQAIPEQVIRSWIEQPEFRDYRVMVEKLLKFKPHILSAAEERIMALQSEVGHKAQETFGALTNVDLSFGSILTNEGRLPLTQSTYPAFLQQPDRAIRQRAYGKFHTVFENHKHSLASLYETSVKQNIFCAQVRSYPDCRSMFLFPDQVDPAVYDSLITSVHEAFPLLHRYYEIRRRMLGLKQLAHYDVYVPMIQDIEMRHTYEEAVELVCKSLAPLGEEYIQILYNGLTVERWVDRYENKGKRSGAFSSGIYSGHPYILLNYKEDILRDVFTIAHEGGHAMHSYYSAHNNPFPSYDYTIFEAEVASTCNEQLLAHYLLSQAKEKKMAAYIVGKQLDDIVATLFRQTMFAEYELLVHRQAEGGEPITVDSLRKTYRDLLTAYFGPHVRFLPVSDVEGMRIPHFYQAFYVYKYATGLSAAMVLADTLINGTIEDRNRYLDFLKSGGSTYPIDSLRKAGVDMASDEPVHLATKKFGNLLDQFETLVS